MAALCLGLVAFSAAFVACGDDDDDGGSEEDKQELVDVTTALVSTDGADFTEEQQEFYLAHITDEFLQEFGTEDVAACEADFATCAGDPLPNATVALDDVEIDGDNAKVSIGTDIGPFGVDFIKDGEEWKADGLFVPSDEVAEGTDVVDLDMKEFAFEFDADSEALKSGDFAFHATNTGEQVHEVVLVQLPAEGTIEELLADDSFEPDPIFVKFGYGPDEESDIALPEPLEAGRYALVCFLPDTSEGVSPEEATPHAFLGMTAEFTVE